MFFPDKRQPKEGVTTNAEGGRAEGGNEDEKQEDNDEEVEAKQMKEKQKESYYKMLKALNVKDNVKLRFIFTGNGAT